MNKNNLLFLLLIFLIIFCIINSNKSSLNYYKNKEFFKLKSPQSQTFQSKSKIFKARNPGFGRIVSVNDNGDLDSFEFPRGIIVMWSGDISKIPDGWALCDGTLSTPDLRGRFIIGTNPNSNKNSSFMVNEMNSKGGSEKALLKHKHKYWQAVSDGDDWKGTLELTYPSSGNKTTVLVSDMGESDGGGADPNSRMSPDTSIEGNIDSETGNTLPPYYALAYIMKL
jgi:hypothetical protein